MEIGKHPQLTQLKGTCVSESQREQSYTSKTTESQSTTQVAKTQFETISEKKEDTQQFEPTIEQIIENLQESDKVIGYIIHLENITSFLEISSKNIMLSQIEIEVVETQGETPFASHVNPLTEPSSSSWDTMPERINFSLFGNMEEQEEERVENEEREADQTFGFPILDLTQNVNMKNINPSVLLTFHGLSTEDPNSFLFEFDILCRRYNYVSDAQKLKLFLATLNDVSLRWFMGLGEYTIRS